MTTNQTIDGVPRELLAFLEKHVSGTCTQHALPRLEELRALLNAPSCKTCCDQGEVPTGETDYQGHWQPPEPVMELCPECGGAPASEPVIDLDATDWAAIQEAASESTWMPSEYMRNEWVADVCRYLREGAAAQLGAEGFYQQVTDADIKKISDYMGNPDMPTGAFLRQDAYDLANMTTYMCREVQALRNKLAAQPKVDPVAWMFRWDYDHGNGWCRNAIRFVERMEHVEHEDKSTWRDIKPLYEGPVDLAQIIEQQKQLIASLRRELVESYSIGAIRPPEVPKSECPACLGDSMFGCDACIPDFSPGNGNRARRRVQAIEKGCPQPQAHPARCGCERGDHE